jgi:hypothetical protein
MIPISRDKEQILRWISYVLRIPKNYLPATALRWIPQGKINTGLPKETWRRTTEKLLTNKRLTWKRAK